MQNPTKCFNLQDILNSYFVLICICKLELDETGTGKIKYRKTLKHHKDIMNSCVLLIKRFSDEVVIVDCKNKKSDFRAILRVRFSLCLYLIILTIPPKKNRELKIKVPMKWMNKRRWGTKCIKLCTEPNTHIMNCSLPVTSNCISSEVLLYCILYLCRFCKLFLSPSMIYWWPQCKHSCIRPTQSSHHLTWWSG